MIFYFSGTGNTLWAAQRLAEATGEQLVSMAEALQHGHLSFALTAGERLGFCFPIHGWQPPGIVRRFLSKAQIAWASDAASPHYCYALCTCGDSTGKAIDMFCRQLWRSQQLPLHAAFALVMPESYVCLPFMHTDPPERERQKTLQAAADLSRFITTVADRQTVMEHLVEGPAPWLLTHVVGAFFNRHMVSDRRFVVDAGQCIHCRRCAQVCPTANIDFGRELPEWHHDGSCTACLACYHHCPRHAINYGDITRKRGQYYFGRNSDKTAAVSRPRRNKF